jgi:hypothetical protein
MFLHGGGVSSSEKLQRALSEKRRQAECVATLLSALCSPVRSQGSLSLLNRTMSEVGRDMRSSVPLFTPYKNILEVPGGGVIVKPCFLSVAPGTQQLVGLLCSLLMDLYQNLFIFWPPSNPTPSSYMRLLSLCLFFSYQSLFLLNPKLNPWSYILH